MSREYPSQPVIGVGAIIWKADQVLLVRQDKYPELGDDFWTLPGGGQEVGETLEAAVLREVHEETGLLVAVGPLVAVLDIIREDSDGGVLRHFTVLDFCCTWLSGEAMPASDVIDTRWVHHDAISDYRMWSVTADVIRSTFPSRLAAHDPSAPAGRGHQVYRAPGAEGGRAHRWTFVGGRQAPTGEALI